MGRGGREGANNNGGSSDGSRGLVVAEPLPLPERNDVIVGLQDECLIYYSRRAGKLLSADVGLEVIIHDNDYMVNASDLSGEIGEIEEELLEKARKNLQENGQVGVVSVDRDVELDFYDGPSHDRLEQRWSQGTINIEALFGVNEKSGTWKEDSVEKERELLENFGSPASEQALKLIAEREGAAEQEQLRRDRVIDDDVAAHDELGPDFFKSPEDLRREEEASDERHAEWLRVVAEERAEDITTDTGHDWQGLSAEEKERRILKAEEIIVDEEVAEAENRAERGY